MTFCSPYTSDSRHVPQTDFPLPRPSNRLPVATSLKQTSRGGLGTAVIAGERGTGPSPRGSALLYPALS